MVWAIPTQPCAVISVLRVTSGFFEWGKVFKGFLATSYGMMSAHGAKGVICFFLKCVIGD
jgi:hypothetical protein